MAARKKRSLRGLGSAPQTHAKSALTYFNRVGRGMRAALDSGSCREAFAEYETMVESFSKGEEHERAAGKHSGSGSPIAAAQT